MSHSTELVDLVDSSGAIVQRAVPRDEVDKYPDLHLQIVIAVITDEDGKILVHQRAKTKKVNPGDVDHVCGGVQSGETPEVAAYRESVEETGIAPSNLTLVVQGVNKYKRFRYLLVGSARNAPTKADPAEAEWVKFVSLDELRSKEQTGELRFVDEFFEETATALRWDDSLPKTSAPAARALASAGVKSLADLAKFSEKEIANLHGMGPKALRILKESMVKAGVEFSK